MNVYPWILGGFVVLSGVYALVLAYAYRRSKEPIAAAGDAHEGGSGTGEDGPVRCRECGTENEPEYRFCRQCVSELPGATVPRPSGATSRSRFLR